MFKHLATLATELPHICARLTALVLATEAHTAAVKSLAGEIHANTEQIGLHRQRLEHVDAKLALWDEVARERFGVDLDERHQRLRMVAGRPRNGGLTG